MFDRLVAHFKKCSVSVHKIAQAPAIYSNTKCCLHTSFSSLGILHIHKILFGVRGSPLPVSSLLHLQEYSPNVSQNASRKICSSSSSLKKSSTKSSSSILQSLNPWVPPCYCHQSIYCLLSFKVHSDALPSLATSHPSVSPTTSTHSLLQIPHPCQDYIPQSRFVYQLPPCRIYFDPILSSWYCLKF